MPIERSQLNEAAIIRLLRLEYGIAVTCTEEIFLGTANCYKLSDGTTHWFLKEFQSGFSEENLRREAALTGFLHARHFPTARMLPTLDGAPFVRVNNRLVCLQEFMDGIPCGDVLQKPALLQAAELLGWLHSLLKDYDLPDGMGADWLAQFSPERHAAAYEELLKLLKPTDTHFERIKADLLYKQALGVRLADLPALFSGLTYCATHGDFSSVQFLCDDDKITAVTDFSAACRLPVVWELTRCFVQSSGVCQDGSTLDTALFCEYLRHYLTRFSLTQADLRNLPYIYLFQLARSRYGYKEYLTGTAENGTALLEFAFRRTDVCRIFERDAAKIGKAVSKLISRHPE
ncbi:MAG: phosphotransferase [Oscillospiraceae bacterium]